MKVGLQFQGSIKRFFYDREEVQKKLTKKRLKSLRWASLSVRKAARRNLRRRKRPSRPGEAPSVYSKDTFATLKNVQVGFDTASEVAIVGAIGFPGVDDPAPGSLEEGTVVRRKNRRRSKRRIGGVGEIEAVPFFLARQRGGKAVKAWDSGVTYSVSYAKLSTAQQVRRANAINEMLYGPETITGTLEPRPFTGPAVKAVAPDFPELYLQAGD